MHRDFLIILYSNLLYNWYFVEPNLKHTTGQWTTYFIVNNFFPENLPVYEIVVMWENMVEPDNPQLKTRRKTQTQNM
jgi:hypothetical protein